VKERTGGQVEMQVFASSQLGSNRDMMEQAVLGSGVISHTDPGYIQDYYANFGVLNGPFLFREWSQARRLVTSPLVKEWAETMRKEKGLRLIALNWYFGPRHMIAHQPLRNPDEMKGKKVRVPPNIMWKETIQAMGGRPPLWNGPRCTPGSVRRSWMPPRRPSRRWWGPASSRWPRSSR